MKIKKLIGSLLTGLIESRAYLRISGFVDEVALAAFKARRGHRKSEQRYSIIVPTIGNGNLGDQAMFDAYVDNVGGDIVAVVNNRHDLHVSESGSSRVSTIALPGLLSGWPLGRIRARLRFLDLVQNASSVSIVGADIMDGGYSRRDSVLRSQLLRMAVALDVPSQILGFSWNGHANASAQRVLERVSKRAILNLRDPLSFERIQSTACENTVLTADTVFALRHLAPAPEATVWVDSMIAKGRKIAIVNTSGLLARRFDLHSEYVKITEALLDRGFAVAILPHVIRKGDDDLAVARELKLSFGREDVFLVNRLWTPRNVAWLASLSSVVVTGRMHLAILALGQGTPAITLATQGKVEGMLGFFYLGKYAVEPSLRISTEIIELIDSVQHDESARRQTILRRLEQVSSDARKNFRLAAKFPATTGN
ncbi:polysaccharide pyruvyl transferase WcaK-like protein [Arthrobacter sp. AG258]|uniref:polysaccharide pyruvyl transferase family protein n=1 Tax=Arthrobacter sp. AG258 TaxID=2183899 RepID=UPI0010D12AF2|nr:polysaccharide pyruvyl transferase family protein [Arthrobacter sp. AG258]TDT85944.1 polysaccharide pyruvyl transferase WcaK-like protein [Arthrobacter sp. AG258]